MPRIDYNIRCSKGELPISPSEIALRYFLGIPIIDPSGNLLSDKSIEFYIRAAVEEFEGFLNIKLSRQIITETQNFRLSDWTQWGFVQTSYPVIEPISLSGMIGTTPQITIPPEWLSSKKSNEGTLFQKRVFLVPQGGSTSGLIYSAVTPTIGWFGNESVPNYWKIVYCSSFDRVPEDILDAVGKLAAINIFNQLGDIILGAGIASQSLGIDGLSQSISTTSSATNAGYGSRIVTYVAELKISLPKLKAKYDGFTLSAL